MERKSEWFCGVKLFRSNFKECEPGVLTKIRFLACGFVVHISLWFLLLFEIDFLDRFFFLSSFPNPFIFRYRSSLLYSQWKCFELHVRTFPAMFFTSGNRFLFRLTMTSWKWLFQWLTSLKKMTSELIYRTLNFMNLYLLKVNSVHLSSAKLICPNSWLLECRVFYFEY